MFGRVLKAELEIVRRSRRILAANGMNFVIEIGTRVSGYSEFSNTHHTCKGTGKPSNSACASIFMPAVPACHGFEACGRQECMVAARLHAAA